MTTYLEGERLREARARYFADNRFGDDGGYGAKWVELKMGPLVIYLRNTAGRVRAVRCHDLHHIATGYQTDWAGEFEISAWEVGGGCGDYRFAWFINLGGMAGGLLLCPRRLFRAFVRGRRGVTLYREEFREELLDLSVGELRRMLRTEGAPPSARASDAAAFAGFCLLAVLAGLVQLVLGVLAWPLGQWNRRLMRREAARKRGDDSSPAAHRSDPES